MVSSRRKAVHWDLKPSNMYSVRKTAQVFLSFVVGRSGSVTGRSSAFTPAGSQGRNRQPGSLCCGATDGGGIPWFAQPVPRPAGSLHSIGRNFVGNLRVQLGQFLTSGDPACSGARYGIRGFRSKSYNAVDDVVAGRQSANYAAVCVVHTSPRRFPQGKQGRDHKHKQTRQWAVLDKRADHGQRQDAHHPGTAGDLLKLAPTCQARG